MALPFRWPPLQWRGAERRGAEPAHRVGGGRAAGVGRRPGRAGDVQRDCGQAAGQWLDSRLPHPVARAPLPGSLGVVPGTGSWRPGIARPGGASADARALARDSARAPPTRLPALPTARVPGGCRRRPRPPVLKKVPPGLRSRPAVQATAASSGGRGCAVSEDSGLKSSFVDGALWAQRTCPHLPLVTLTETLEAGMASSLQ